MSENIRGNGGDGIGSGLERDVACGKIVSCHQGPHPIDDEVFEKRGVNHLAVNVHPFGAERGA